ncbi:hypothetical protein D1007_36795 [Hordeum vulgare]|nr:hypothetical protein D1007_36795 [Hordeum vulgare]
MQPANMAESEDDWGLDPEELQKVCVEAEAQFAKKKQKEKLDTEERSVNKARINDQDARTPTTKTAPVVAAHVASSSRTPAAVGHERRVGRAPTQLRSLFIDPGNADPFHCSKEVCGIYDIVLLAAFPPPSYLKRSKPIINYDEFFITCTKLANSMAPGRKMDSIVAEVAIIALREPGLKTKKSIMPLQITISFPTLKVLEKENPKETGHYWLLVLNIRDKRTYCSMYMMYNVEHSDDTHVLEYGQKDILSMRKILTTKMLKSYHNDVNWVKMFNIKKVKFISVQIRG